ncbi:MAG: iron ABC transporter permease [Bacteroidales bacterium]|nr:iron ABC transporter permease [Bacteroidales bacterium]MBN2633331.1 iron ABC transporter permease [Bacteroidales bacterium]
MIETEVLKKYNNYTRKRKSYLWIVLILMLVFAVLGISVGPSKVSMGDFLSVISGYGDETKNQIIFNLRLPRILAAILSGAALSVSGVVMQSILRNPLGSPFTLGLSNAAAFGAALAVILFGAGSTFSSNTDAVIISNPYITTISAFFWSLVASLLIIIVARKKGATPENMILTGIIASTLFTALTTGLQYIADDIQLSAIVFWTFGDLSKGGWKELLIQSLIILPVLLYFYYNRWNYNAIDSGDEAAHSLGTNTPALRLSGMIAASLATAAVVSFYGIIAFVGLVVPHIVRRIIGSNERFLIPGAALSGSAFLLGCDILARTVISPMVLPVGIITSLVGAPLFIFLLMRGIGSSQWK